MIHELKFVGNNTQTTSKLLDSVSNLIESMLGVKVIYTAYQEEEQSHHPSSVTAEYKTQVVLDKVEELEATVKLMDECDLQYQTYPIVRGDTTCMVGKKAFLHWCNAILHFVPADAPIGIKFQMLVTNGISRQKLFTLLEWPDMAIKDMIDTNIYPYMLKAWQKYFGPNNVYSIEALTRKEEDKKENHRIFREPKVEQPKPTAPEYTPQKSVQSIAGLDEQLVMFVHDIRHGLIEVEDPATKERMIALGRKKVEQDKITGLVPLLDWFGIYRLRHRDIAHILGLPYHIIPGIKNGQAYPDHRTNLMETFGVPKDTTFGMATLGKVNGSYAHLFSNKSKYVMGFTDEEIAEAKHNVCMEAFHKKNFKSSLEFFDQMTAFSISTKWFAYNYQLAYASLQVSRCNRKPLNFATKVILKQVFDVNIED